MKKEIELAYSNDPILKSYTHHAFVNAVSNYYFEKKIRVSFFLENFETYSSHLINTTYKCQDGTIEVYKNNIEEESSQFYLYKEAKENEKIQVTDIDYKFVQSYGNINLFITYEDNKEKFIDDDKIIKFGLFERGEFFVKVNHEFVFTKRVDTVDVGSLFMKKTEKWIVFSYRDRNNREYELYQLELNPIFELKPILIGVNINTDKEFYFNNIYMNYVQLFTKYDAEGNLMLDYFARPQRNYDYYTFDKYISFQRYMREELCLLFKKDIKYFIYRCLKLRKYVILYIDAYYLEETVWYRKEHKQLELMIFSCMKDTWFKGVYIDGTQLIASKIPWKMFNKSLCGERIITMQYSPQIDMSKIPIDSLIVQIEDFIKSRDTSKKLFGLSGVMGDKFGLSIYDEILGKKDNLLEFSQNPRLSYVLLEHTFLMQKRINYLFNKGILNRKYEDVLEILICDMKKMNEDIVKGKELNYLMVKSRELLLRRKKIEKKFYSEILEKLKKG